MRKYWATVLSVVAGSLLLASAAAGDESQVDKLRGRADEMMRDVQQMHEQGKHDEAQRLEREVAELREQAERIARDSDQQPGPGEVIANRLRELSRQWGKQKPGPDEGTANRLRELSQQWIDAMASEQRDVAERLQKEIHDIARDTGVRVQEIMKPQLEMIERKIAELRERGQPDAAERLAAQLRDMVQAHRRAMADQQRERAQSAEREAKGQVESERQTTGPGREENWQQKVQEMKKRIEGLRQQGKQDQADRLVKELDQMRDRRAEGESRDGGREEAKRREQQQRERAEREAGGRLRPEDRPGLGPDQRADMDRRVHHLRVAAENLNAIGMKDVAERLNCEAEEIQKALQNPPPQGEDLHRGVMEVMQKEFRNLHQRLDELNRRLDELTESMRRDR